MKHKSSTFRFICTVFLALLLLACKTKVKTLAAEPEEKSAFYTLSLTKDTLRSETKAVIKGVNVVNAKTRYLPDEAKSKDAYFLKIEVTYKNNRTVLAYVEHPLYKRLDLYEESGQIESKLISLQQGEVVFRVPYFEEYAKIRITETVNFRQLTPIILKHEK